MELLRRMGGGCNCFNNAPTNNKVLKVKADSSGHDFFDGSATVEKPLLDHLVIMVNGIIGSPADWRYAAEQFAKKLPDKVIVHRSECNSFKLTLDGVDTMSERLVQEVLSVVRRWPGLHKISFVAHSLGGLVARYDIARLYDHSSTLEPGGTTTKCCSEDHKEYSKHCLEQHCEP